MENAWVIRSFPHGKNRIEEFLTKKDRQEHGNGIVAVGWPNIGDLTNKTTRDEIKQAIKSYYKHYSPKGLGHAAGTIYRFKEEMKIGDYALVPDGRYVYIGKIVSDYIYDERVDSNNEGYPHQRYIEWVYHKRAIPRKMLTGRLFDSLKGQQTFFAAHYEDVHTIVTEKRHFFTMQNDIEIKEEYLKKFQSGQLFGVNSSSFEEAVCSLLELYFPGLRRLATTNSEEGDTDLYAKLPGDIQIRIQVKHFYPKNGELQPWVVDQLADSMNEGEQGIIITSGIISEQSLHRAEEIFQHEYKMISFINGEEFVDLLFQNIENLPEESLATFGLAKKIVFF